MVNHYKFIKGEFSDSSLFVPKSYVFRGVDCLGYWTWINRRKRKVIRYVCKYSPFRNVFYDVVRISFS